MIGWFRPAAPTGLRRIGLGRARSRRRSARNDHAQAAGQIAAAVTHEAFR